MRNRNKKTAYTRTVHSFIYGCALSAVNVSSGGCTGRVMRNWNRRKNGGIR